MILRTAFFSFFGFGGLLLLSSCQTGAKRARKGNNHHALAVSLISKCDNRRALKHLLKSVALQPKNFLARHTLASVYFFLGQYELAAKEFERILRIKPGFTEARVNLAKTYIERGKLEKALEEMKKARQDLTYASRWKITSQRGQAYFKKREFLKARQLFAETLTIPPAKDCFNTVYLGRALMALNRLEEAEETLIQAFPLCQNETPLCREKLHEEHFFLTHLYIKKRNRKKASYHLNIFLKRAAAENPYLSEAKSLLKTLKETKDNGGKS